jgi:hypothetical protein
MNRRAGKGQAITVYFNCWGKLTVGGLKICLKGPKNMDNM